MFKQTLLATAAAGLLAMAAIPTAASAGNVPMWHGGDNGYNPGWHEPRGNPGGQDLSGRGDWGDRNGGYCGVRTVKWWDAWGNPHWSQVANACPPPRHWGGDWNDGWHRPGGYRPWGGWTFGFSFHD